MSLPQAIFRAYDIRGLYPNEINETGVEILGRALGTLFSKKNIKNVVVGTDSRSSSASLANSFISGLLSAGINVTDTGITVEPAIHYFTFLDQVDAAINITASHNPGQFNGIKIDYKNAVPLYGEELQLLYALMTKGKFIKGNGTYKKADLNPLYIEMLASKFKLKSKLKVAVYCGNGATSNIYPEILTKIGADVLPIRCYTDNQFPTGVPDPESGNFYPELKAEVLDTTADIGVGFDGDGDRVGFVDEVGSNYNSDQLLMLFAKDVLSKIPGAHVVFDVKSSALLADYIKKLGGVPQMLKTGRAYFLDKMYKNQGVLGGELSGHFYFKDDYFGFDDGIYAACRLLKIVEDNGKKLSELMSLFPKSYSTPELKIPCADETKFDTVNKFISEIEKTNNKYELIKIDGIRVKTSPTGWFLVRASNTSPYLSLRVEGKDSDEVSEIMNIVAKTFAKIGFNLARE